MDLERVHGEVGTCGIILLEVLFSARNAADYRRTRQNLLELMNLIPTVHEDLDRALDLMELPARRGHHRGAGLPDLLIAAVAERNGLTVVHYDADFDLIGAVTGQPMELVVPRGSV